MYIRCNKREKQIDTLCKFQFMSSWYAYTKFRIYCWNVCEVEHWNCFYDQTRQYFHLC